MSVTLIFSRENCKRRVKVLLRYRSALALVLEYKVQNSDALVDVVAAPFSHVRLLYPIPSDSDILELVRGPVGDGDDAVEFLLYIYIYILNVYLN